MNPWISTRPLFRYSEESILLRVVRIEERGFVRIQFCPEYVVLYSGIVEHDLAGRLNRFRLEENDSEATVVRGLGPACKNDYAIFCESFQVVEVVGDYARFEFVSSFREHVVAYWLDSVKELLQAQDYPTPSR